LFGDGVKFGPDAAGTAEAATVATGVDADADAGTASVRKTAARTARVAFRPRTTRLRS
jgi:hypothetical protein